VLGTEPLAVASGCLFDIGPVLCRLPARYRERFRTGDSFRRQGLPMKPEFNEDHTPLAYLITFRCYETWLHGDDRGSVDRHHNSYGAPLIAPNGRWLQHSQSLLKQQAVKLSETQRLLVKAAIGHTCERRGWGLFSVNVRTNHVHVVVAAACGPSRVLNGLKSNATRELREAGNWRRAQSVG